MSDRAKRRLEIARDVLALDPAATSDQILFVIRQKEKKEQETLRSVVDWVEEYELHERNGRINE